jgi:hypothetical protein
MKPNKRSARAVPVKHITQKPAAKEASPTPGKQPLSKQKLRI